MDITTTATIRPGTLNRTYESFWNNMLEGYMSRYSYQLIINVDPIGEVEYQQNDVVRIAKYYFTKVLSRTPLDASFPDAFLWCWDMVGGDFVLHLEDDWELLRKVDLQEMVNLMVKYPNIALLRLSLWDAEIDRVKQWNKYFPWNGEFFECPDELKASVGFSGNPSLIRKSFIKQILPYLVNEGCPEKQIKGHNVNMRNILESWRYGVFSQPLELKAVIDIGREWRTRNNFHKNGSYGFETWIRK
jgi:hypothetical protein